MLTQEDKLQIEEQERYRAEVRQRLSPGESKSRTLAIVLALFFGSLGAHKFYLNKPGWGLIYILASWTFIPLMASFVEAVMYLTMSDSDFRNKYK